MLAAAVAAAVLLPAGAGFAQDDQPDAKAPGTGVGVDQATGLTASELLHVPVVNLQIGGVSKKPNIKNPVADDPDAVTRGMNYFVQFNCVGCHAANGAGGMGPALSNAKFLFGSEPQNIYLTILQGRSKGMPSWAGRLPDHVIWDLVAYIGSISKEPSAKSWGKTVSLDSFKIEQVPAEYITTTEPWKHTEPFSYGQKPFAKVKTPEK